MNIRLSLFFLLSIIWAGTSCSYQDLRFQKGEKMDVKKIGTDKTTISMEVVIENPNNYAIRVSSCHADAFINSIRIGKVFLDKPIRLKAKSSQSELITIELESGAMMALIPSFLFSNDILVKLDGTVKGNVFLFAKKFPINYEQSIPKTQLFKF